MRLTPALDRWMGNTTIDEQLQRSAGYPRREYRLPTPQIPAPPPEPEKIDPDYPVREYRLYTSGKGTYFVQWREKGGAWETHDKPKIIGWNTITSSRSVPEYSATEREPHHFLSKEKAHEEAKAIAKKHYKDWQLKKNEGTIIELGNLL